MMLTLCTYYFVRVWVRLVFPIEVKFMFVTNKVHIQIEASVYFTHSRYFQKTSKTLSRWLRLCQMINFYNKT